MGKAVALHSPKARSPKQNYRAIGHWDLFFRHHQLRTMGHTSVAGAIWILRLNSLLLVLDRSPEALVHQTSTIMIRSTRVVGTDSAAQVGDKIALRTATAFEVSLPTTTSSLGNCG
jgi:hypothetical protein